MNEEIHQIRECKHDTGCDGTPACGKVAADENYADLCEIARKRAQKIDEVSNAAARVFCILKRPVVRIVKRLNLPLGMKALDHGEAAEAVLE